MLKSYFHILIKSPEHRFLKNELDFNMNPNQIKYYSIPYKNEVRNVSKSNNRFSKVYKYIKYTKLPFIILNNNSPYQLFQDTERYIFINELFKHDLDYTKTERYLKFKYLVDAGTTIKKKYKYNIKSENNLKKYFEDYIDLLKSMKNNGYNHSIKQDPLLIWIGPKGEPIKNLGGRHRLAAAQVTNVSHVPVKIAYVHQNWLNSNKSEFPVNAYMNNLEFIRQCITIFKNKYCF